MKKQILISLVTFLLSWGSANSAGALTLADVGSIDTLVASTKLNNAGDPLVTTWIQGILGSDYELGYKDDLMGGDWTELTGSNKDFAYNLVNDTEYFLVKIGTGSLPGSTWDTYLFKNIGEMNWAVISYEDMFGPQGIDWTVEKVNVGRISHITEIGGSPVPEPATMLLFGTGLVGLAGIARRKVR